MGALDVCPFIPVRGVSMDECVLCAQAFGQRLAEELGVPGECPREGVPAGPPHWVSVSVRFLKDHLPPVNEQMAGRNLSLSPIT